MLKHIHMLFALLVLISFIGRVALQQFKPESLQNKLIKIGPHVIATLLLVSGFVLVFQGNWAEGDMGWIYSKLILVVVFIGLGIYTMKAEGMHKWLAAAGALASIVYIFAIAFSKQGFM